MMNMNQTGAAISKPALWTGWILSGLTIAFMLLDSVSHFAVPAPVVEAFNRLGFPIHLSQTLAIILLISVLLYVIPKTAVLGAILLTGYLGGAVSIQMRAGSPTFETVFPVIFGALAWAGLWLRDARLRTLLPFRRP